MSGITLITTERNEKAAIGEFIESVFAQSLAPDELIIADGDSTDGTKERIEEYIQKGFPIKLLVVPGNRSIGRNKAIEAAQNEIIAVSDVGCRLDPHWLLNITEPFRSNPAAMAVAGFFLPEPKTYFERVSTELMLQSNEKVDVTTWLPSSRSIAFKIEAWRAVGGYPEYAEFNPIIARKCGGEDTLFDLAIKAAGYRFEDGLSAVVYWRPRKNIREFYTQYFWYAVGDGLDLTGLADHRHFKALSLRYLMLAVLTVLFFAVSPWLSLLFLLYLGYKTAQRIAPAWKKRRDPKALPLMAGLIVLYDLSQVFGYWYGRLHRKKGARR